MIYLFSLFLGLSLGSFANVCVYRLPHDQSLFTPASHCPHCQTPLRWRDNIPLFSYGVLRGRCHFCSRPIAWRYPALEAGMAALFLLHAGIFQGDVARLVLADLLTFYLLTISVIDYQHKIIPDELSLSLIVLGWLLSVCNPFLGGLPLSRIAQSVLAGMTGGLVMLGIAWLGEKIFKKEALGGGDIKYVAGLGAVLGWHGLLGSLFLGSIIGGFVGILLLLLKKKGRGETLPFGPFLSLGAYAVLFAPKAWFSLFSLDIH